MKVEIKDKILLNVTEAAEYSGIGQKKIRALMVHPACPFVLKCGERYMIKRRAFEKYLEESAEI